MEDPTGVVVNSMEYIHRGDPLRINTKILQKWIRGQERRPVSYRTLIEVLQDIQLHELAKHLMLLDIKPSFPCRKNDINKRDNKAVAATEQLKNVINCYLISAVVAIAKGLLNAVNLQCLQCLDIIVMELR